MSRNQSSGFVEDLIPGQELNRAIHCYFKKYFQFPKVQINDMSAFQAHKVLAIGGTGAQGVPVVQGLYFTTTLAFLC
jgi:hypothetical protein